MPNFFLRDTRAAKLIKNINENGGGGVVEDKGRGAGNEENKYDLIFVTTFSIFIRKFWTNEHADKR